MMLDKDFRNDHERRVWAAVFAAEFKYWEEKRSDVSLTWFRRDNAAARSHLADQAVQAIRRLERKEGTRKFANNQSVNTPMGHGHVVGFDDTTYWVRVGFTPADGREHAFREVDLEAIPTEPLPDYEALDPS